MLRKVLATAAILAAMSTTSMAANGWTTNSVNFREGPGTNYYSLGSISRCAQIVVGEQQNGWYRVQWNGRWGWVSARYISWDRGYCGNRAPGYARPAPKRNTY